MQRLSEGTRKGYSAGWEQWCLFRGMQNKDPWLEGRTREERLADEEALIEFVVFLAQVMQRGDGTLKQRLFAVRYAHIAEGFGDPTLHRSRLWSVVNGFARWRNQPTRRKKPATPRMLRWIHSYLFSAESGYSKGDASSAWLAISTAFFFLLRASEYLVQEDKAWSRDRVLRGEDVAARLGNQELSSFAEAEEAVINIRSSKTDQYNAGCVRNQYGTGELLDPVAAFAQYEKEFPQRLDGKEAHLPLMRWADGRDIKREEIQGILQLAAIAERA